MSFPPHHQYHGFSFHSYDNSEQISPSFVQGGGPFMLAKRSVSFGGIERCEEDAINAVEEELSDNESNLGEKKKRLSMEQVKALEKSFELGNKLEPERKTQLAKALGLQPRQVAIWFQNRRARWKTKQLERDYDALKKQFDSLKADNETLHAHNKKLRAQLVALKGGDSSEVNDQGSWSENSCDVNVNARKKNQISTSPASSHLTMNHLFPLQNPHRKEPQNESFGGMFNNGGEAAAGLWPWPEQLGSFTSQSHFAHN